MVPDRRHLRPGENMAVDPGELKATHMLIDLHSCLLRKDAPAARLLLSDESVDFAALKTVLFRNHVEVYFFRLMQQSGCEGVLPEFLVEEIEKSELRQGERLDRLLELLSGVRDRLSAESIPFLSLKGFYLSQRFFEGAHARFMWDLDVLVHPDDLERAIGAVENLGLERKSSIPLDPRSPMWGLHAVELKGKLGSIDIHSAIRNLPGIEFDYDAIWSAGVEFEVDGEVFSSIGPEDTLLISALGVGTDIQCSHHNLRKMLDIFLMLREMDSYTDWNAFLEKRRREGSLKLILNVFAFCLEFLRVREECPRLAQAMESEQKLVSVRSIADAEAIYARGRQNLINRMFFARMLPISIPAYWYWWLRPLPVRFWHYR